MPWHLPALEQIKQTHQREGEGEQQRGKEEKREHNFLSLVEIGPSFTNKKH